MAMRVILNIDLLHNLTIMQSNHVCIEKKFVYEVIENWKISYFLNSISYVSGGLQFDIVLYNSRHKLLLIASLRNHCKDTIFTSSNDIYCKASLKNIFICRAPTHQFQFG